MSDRIQQATVAAKNSTELYRKLSELTTGRSENRGTLQVSKDGDSVTLSCVNHHYLSRRNTFVDSSGQNAFALRNLVRTAVEGELDALGARLKQSSRGVDANVIDKKIDQLKAHFKLAILTHAEEGPYASFSRKDIEKVLLDVDALKENLCVESLLEMSPESLVKLASPSNGGILAAAQEYRQKDDQIRGALEDFKAKLRSATSANPIFDSCKDMVATLYKRVAGRVKTLNNILNYLENPETNRTASFAEVRNFIRDRLNEAKNGGENGLTGDLLKSLDECHAEIKEKNLRSLRNCDENLSKKLKDALTQYRAILNDLPSVYNAALEKCGIKGVFIGPDGTVELKSPRDFENENSQIEQVRKDFGKLGEFEIDMQKDAKALAIGISPESIGDKVETLSARSEKVAKAVEDADLFQMRRALTLGHEATNEFQDTDGRFLDSFLNGEFKETLAEKCRGKGLSAYVSFAVNFFDQFSLTLKNLGYYAQSEFVVVVDELRNFLNDEANAGKTGRKFYDDWIDQKSPGRSSSDLKDFQAGRRVLTDELKRVISVACDAYDGRQR